LCSRPIFAAILALTVLASWAAVEAQPSVKIARIGFLYFGSREPGPGAARYAAFLEGLRELGYVEGKDLIVEPRFAESSERLLRYRSSLRSLPIPSSKAWPRVSPGPAATLRA
jgi:hypothetical protein